MGFKYEYLTLTHFVGSWFLSYTVKVGHIKPLLPRKVGNIWSPFISLLLTFF